MTQTLLVNPVGVVHDRNVAIIQRMLPKWRIKRIYNTRLRWFSDKKADENCMVFDKNGGLPVGALDGISAVLMFTAQPRLQPMNLICEAAFRDIPVIALEEKYQMTFEHGLSNNYMAPVDKFLVASKYERECFIEIGCESDTVETSGYIFGSRDTRGIDPAARRKFREELKIPDGQRLVVLTLAFLSPGIETKAVRARMLNVLDEGLPVGYRLAIKPHPAEDDPEFDGFVKKHAPSAIVIDKLTPIESVMNVADIIFNRGNSQTVLDAIQTGVAAALVPVDRETLFDGVIDELVVRRPEDVIVAIKFLEDGGMGVYKALLDKYFPISCDEAVGRAAAAIESMAEGRSLYKPSERLVKVALLYALQGCDGIGLRLIKTIEGRFNDAPFTQQVAELISMKADAATVKSLYKWLGGTYMEYVLKALWVKTLYHNRRRATPDDEILLEGFPPVTNKYIFIQYIPLLYWTYYRSGMKRQCSELLDRLHDQYDPIEFIETINSKGRKGAVLFNPLYWKTYIIYKMRRVVNSLRYRGPEFSKTI